MSNPHRVSISPKRVNPQASRSPIELNRYLVDGGLPQYQLDFSDYSGKNGLAGIRDVVVFHVEGPDPDPQSRDIYVLFRDGNVINSALNVAEADRQLFHAARKYASINSEGRPILDKSGVQIRVSD